MKKYIDFNTEKRMNGANDFEKDFFELMINSVYGKTMENLRNRINMRLVSNAEVFLSYFFIAKMKDEFDRVIVFELVGLKSKIYSMKNIDGKEYNTAKGVTIMTGSDKFKDVLFNQKITRHKMKRIQSKKHKLGTYENHKIYLSCFNNKRYVLDDGIRKLAYFHKDSVTSCREI